MPCQSPDPPPLPSAHVQIATPRPFSFHLTAGHQTFFRGRTGADYYEAGVYRRVLDPPARPPILVEVSPGATEDTLDVALRGHNLDGAAGVWGAGQVRRIFALDADFAEFVALAEVDPLVGALAGHFPGLRPARAPTVFEALAQAIIGQQISGVVARRIRDLVVDALGAPFEAGGRTYRAYPRPAAFAAASIDDLRGLKLSRRKAEYLRDIGARIAAGDLDLEALRELPDDEVVAHLSALRGVGRWTAEWVMLRALGRPDAFPAGDLALWRALDRYYQPDKRTGAKEAAALAERWRGQRGLVTAYLFAAIRQGIDLTPTL